MDTSLGVHQFKNYGGSSSFFIQRMYGNYLVLADFFNKMDFEFFKSKGGIYRQFLEDDANINQTHVQVFRRLGAYAVITDKGPAELSHPQIPVETYGGQFSDHSMTMFSRGSVSCLRMDQRGRNIAFFGNQYILDDCDRVSFGGEDITDEVEAFIYGEGIDFCFFGRHTGEAVLRRKKFYSLCKFMKNLAPGFSSSR